MELKLFQKFPNLHYYRQADNNFPFSRSSFDTEKKIKSDTNFSEEFGVPFKVDLVSDAKCQDKVFVAGVPKFNKVRHRYHS